MSPVSVASIAVSSVVAVSSVDASSSAVSVGVSQMEITEHLYAQDFERESNSIEVLVGRVRKRLGNDIIKTRRGFGYSLGGDEA